jgi:ribosomal protein S18 acetylase RimI-like enzyme
MNQIRSEKSRDVQIRLAEPADAPAIASLLYNSFVEYRAQYTPEAFATTVSTPDQVQDRIKEGPVWVALENRAVVGTISAVLKDEGLYIRGMAVDPSARGKRIGRKLLDCAELFAVRMRCSRLFLSTTPFLARAIKLYEDYGFHRHSEGPDNLFGTPLFTMVKGVAD